MWTRFVWFSLGAASTLLILSLLRSGPQPGVPEPSEICRTSTEQAEPPTLHASVQPQQASAMTPAAPTSASPQAEAVERLEGAFPVVHRERPDVWIGLELSIYQQESMAPGFHAQRTGAAVVSMYVRGEDRISVSAQGIDKSGKIVEYARCEADEGIWDDAERKLIKEKLRLPIASTAMQPIAIVFEAYRRGGVSYRERVIVQMPYVADEAAGD